MTAASLRDAKQPGATISVAELAKKAEATAKNLGGFQFSGDFRVRTDLQFRSSNEFAGPVQRVRGCFRVRLNIDKVLDPHLNFRLQLATGQFNNVKSVWQDFGAMASHYPIGISEAYLDYHPTSNISLRAGVIEDVLADRMRFLWGDEGRFSGSSQIVKVPLGENVLGIKSIEFRSGEYILSHPNVTVLSASSPFVSAGYTVGQKVRDANLFHHGFVINGELGPRWTQRFMGGIAIYRNPNQIQLASTSAGFPVVMNNTLGFALWAPLTGSGNATTTPGGAILNAGHYQIAHTSYRLERKGVLVGSREMPFFLDLALSRNVGAGKLRDAITASANLGEVKKGGDLRFLYQWGIKDANSMIAQFTDDAWATSTGVNFAGHAVRVDLGLTRFLQFQNLFFVQTNRRASNPAEHFYVTVPRGANPLFRFMSQLAITF